MAYKKSELTRLAEKCVRMTKTVRAILAIFVFFAYLSTGIHWVDLKLMIEERRDTKERSKLQEEESAQEWQNEMMTAVKRK